MRSLSAVLLAALLLAGCGGGGDDEKAAPEGSGTASPGPTTTDEDPPGEPATSGPDCRKIWRSGQTLPEDFTTCVLDGRVPEFDVTECVDGSKLIVADNTMWGRTGEGEIKRPKESPLQDTDEYGTDWSLCTGK